MYTFDLYFPEPSIIVWANHQLLPDVYRPLKHHARKDWLTVLVEGLCDMELSMFILV
jgi:hypothetical protein